MIEVLIRIKFLIGAILPAPDFGAIRVAYLLGILAIYAQE
jgi:hypothetical protein